MRGEESISIVRRGKWVWKTYRPLDPTGRWPSRAAWRSQLKDRAIISREAGPVLFNPVRRWLPKSLTAVSLFIEASRPSTERDAELMWLYAPKWLGDITPSNIIVIDSQIGELRVLIDFCVKNV